MARIRTIKPDLCKDETLGQLGIQARFMFVGLITTADDYGRFRAHPALIRAEVFPYDDTPLDDVRTWLAELVATGRVTTYVIDGQTYGQISNWAKHQRIDNAGRSDIPPPATETHDTTTDSAGCGEPPQPSANLGDSRLEKEKEKEEDKEEDKELTRGSAAARSATDPTDTDFDTFWQACPRKASKPAAQRAYKHARTTAPAATILAGITAWADAWARDGTDPKFIPHPATWLNGHRWNDTPPPAATTAPPTAAPDRRAADALQNAEIAKYLAVRNAG